MAFTLPQLEVYKTNLAQVAQVVELLYLRETYTKIAEEDNKPDICRPAIESINKKISGILKLDWGGRYNAS